MIQLACIITTILVIWFKTNAVIEYGRKLGLTKFLKIEEYLKKKDEDDDNAEMNGGSIDDWLGVRRPGMKHEHKEGFAHDDPVDSPVEEFESSESDDDDDHGGQMMPVPGM